MYENMTKEELIKELNKINNRNPYGLTFETDKIKENVLIEMQTKYPVFKEHKELKIEGKGSENYLIEGDNLHTLTCLQTTHKNKIDVIYIDPPYNTGNEDFIYNDHFVDNDDSYRHSKWLNFMEKRLLLAKELLCENGFIAVSIDENEFAQLKLLLDNIFGEFNRVSTHHIQVRYGNKNLNKKKDFQELIEYCFIYAKNKQNIKFNLPVKKFDVSKFNFSIKEGDIPNDTVILGGKKVEVYKEGNYSLKKNHYIGGDLERGFKETWASGSVIKGNTSGKFADKYLSNLTSEMGEKTLYKVYGIGEDGLGYRFFLGPSSLKSKQQRCRFFNKIPSETLSELANGNSTENLPISNFYDFSADFGNIVHEGGIPYNKGKKPIKLIKQIINYHKNKDITVLDFFAGSGSTGHAVLDLNQEDGGNRNFILCQKVENNIDITKDITYQRFLNVRDNYDFKLNYLSTDFVKKQDKRSTLKSMSKKCLTLLQLENNTFNELYNDGYSYVFSNNTKKIGICIMSNSFDINEVNFECFKDCDKIYYYDSLILNDKLSSIFNEKKLIKIPSNIMKILEGAL